MIWNYKVIVICVLELELLIWLIFIFNIWGRSWWIWRIWACWIWRNWGCLIWRNRRWWVRRCVWRTRRSWIVACWWTSWSCIFSSCYWSNLQDPEAVGCFGVWEIIGYRLANDCIGNILAKANKQRNCGHHFEPFHDPWIKLRFNHFLF